jgi:hypothetical protein
MIYTQEGAGIGSVTIFPTQDALAALDREPSTENLAQSVQNFGFQTM